MKNDGFVLIESVFCLAIILTISMLITNVIKSNYVFIDKQKQELEMLDLLKSNLEITKKQIKSGENVESAFFSDKNYKIEKIIENKNYYTKIYLKVFNKEKFIDFTSYVFKQ